MPRRRARRRRRGTRSSSLAVGDTAEAVAKALLEFLQLAVALDFVQLLVQGDTFAWLGHIVGGQQQPRSVSMAQSATRITPGSLFLGAALGGIGGGKLGEFFGAQFGNCLLEDFLVCLIAEVGYESALFGAKEVAGTADVEVLHGNVCMPEPRSEKLSIACRRLRASGVSGYPGGMVR